MAQIKKILFRSYLEELPILINDTNVNSTYFGVNNFPSILTAGKSYFLIGGSNFLKPGTDVQIEVLDANGNTIYYEIADALLAGTYRLVSLFIYSTTPVGMATVTVVGEASSMRQTDGSTVSVPSNWTGKPNVRWSRQVKVDTLKGDTAEAILKKLPSILMTEIYDESRSFDVVNIPMIWQVPATDGQGAMRTAFGDKSTNAYYYMKLVSSSFTKEMEGGIVHFKDPVVTPFGYLKPFDTQITYVVNEKLARVSPSMTYQSPYLYNGGPVSDRVMGPVEVPTLSEFTMSYFSQSLNTGSISKKLSYLHVNIKNLDTYGGMVKYVDIYRQPGNIYMGRWPTVPNEKLTSGYHFNSFNDFADGWTISGQNLWQVQMTTTASIEQKDSITWPAPTSGQWDSASAQHGVLYTGLMYDTGQSIPNINSLTLNYNPTTKFFGNINYDYRIAKLTTYVYATASFYWGNISVTYDTAFSIYVNNVELLSRDGLSNYDSTQWSVLINSGTNKIDIYLENYQSSYYLTLGNSLSQNGAIDGMNALVPPPAIHFDSTKLLNAIKVESRLD
jgi:hypothetical protein